MYKFKQKRYIHNIFFTCLFCVTIPINIAYSVSIPINISESIPTDISGVARNNDLASFGIPIRDSESITSINQLGISGANDYQFRELGRYPSGNIKWVLIDLLATVSAGNSTSVSLINGTGQSAGPDIAIDNNNDGTANSNYITIDTGVATFVIKKSNFNFLDMVRIGSDTIIKYDTSSGMVINDGTTTFISSNDNSSSTYIEENGPVKACIKSTGTMRSGASNSYLAYSARLYFVKGQTYCKAVISVSNSSNDLTKNQKAVKEFGVSLKLNTTGTIEYLFARNGQEVSGTGDGYLYQGYVDHFNQFGSHDSRDLNLIVGDNGLFVNGTNYADEHTAGYASVSSGGHHIDMAMANMGGYWPAGFEVQADGDVTIDIYSSRNSVTPNLAWGQHQSREIIFNFSSSDTKPENALFRINYPLMGRTSLTQYKETGAILGNHDLISLDEQDDWIRDNGYPDRSIPSGSSAMHVQRHYDWASTGGFQNDWEEVDLLDWIRGGDDVLFNRARTSARFRIDDAIQHSDNFSWANDLPSYSNSAVWNSPFDTGHMFWESLPSLYYLTGDMFIYEALEDFGEYYYEWSSRNEWRPQNTCGGDIRVWSRNIKILALLAEFFDNQVYKDALVNVVKKYSTCDGKINRNRGFINVEGLDYLKTAQLSRVHADALYHVYRVLRQTPDTEALVEDLSDLMLGWGYFQINTEYVNAQGLTPYTYYIDKTNIYSDYRGCDLNWFYNHSYDVTGDINFFSKREGGYWLTVGRGQSTWGERSVQAFISRDINRKANQTGFVLPTGGARVDILQNHVSQNGSIYTLSWEAPQSGITKYQIKFSDKPIVRNLSFNQNNRSFTYDPNLYSNFWASLNTRNEPIPAQSGQTSVTIDVSKVIADYNQLYGLTSTNSEYRVYDPNATYYFAVKYWIESPRPLILNITE